MFITKIQLSFGGFEAAAPCKGNDISAQGKADRRTATPWVSPNEKGLIPFKPSSGWGPRVSFTSFTISWAEIPLPLQGAATSKPLI